MATRATTAKRTTRKKAGEQPHLLRITQVRSGIGRPEKHRATLRALGLRHQRSVVQKDTPAIRGMIFQVQHLVRVQELEKQATAPEEPTSRARTRKAADA
ncbi:MAG: 50S ribosomal protein L30 [Gemmatimonadetes bacterium]|nr:50S ribosomal protein L30 [Gemmatimonadota bacterium]